jgi:excisionase family DNA binding protein
MSIPNDPLITERELAERLGCSRELLRVYRREGRGPGHLKIGRLVRYRTSDVEAWLAAQRVIAS